MLDLDFSWDSLSKNVEQNIISQKKGFEPDTRFWRISKDENKNGLALIRLLPDSEGKVMTRVYHYSLKKFDALNKRTKWFIANSPESIGLPCPVKEHYTKLTSLGTTEGAEEAKNFKRQQKFITNVYIVNDPANPENNGKVFLWEFGVKFRDKILAWLQPSENELAMGEEPKALFNPLQGNSIKLKNKMQGEFQTLDGSEVSNKIDGIFQSKEQAIEFIKANTHKLSEFESPEGYDSYEELTKRFNYFLNDTPSTQGGNSGNNGSNGTGTSNSSTSGSIDTGLDFGSSQASQTVTTNTSTVQQAQAQSTSDDDWLDDL